MPAKHGPSSLFIVAKPGVAWTPKGCMIMQVYENVAIQSLTLFIELILLSRGMPSFVAVADHANSVRD